MTDELDPQTQQHIDDSADVTADADAVTCDDIDLDDPILDESATAETPAPKMQASKMTMCPLRTTPLYRMLLRKLRALSRFLRKKSSTPSWTP